MKSITIILKKIKNLLPYFLLIAIYFFFVNMEAKRDEGDLGKPDILNLPADEKSYIDNNKLRIKIPVIPFSQ